MLNKKAMELSLNFIVIIIISIIIFGFGIRFISNLSSEAVKIQDIAIDDLDERISNVVCEGSDRVCIGNERMPIRRKELGVFGLKILNVLDSQEFEVTVTPSNPLGYKKDNTPITNPPLLVNPPSRNVYIGKNEEAKVAIGVQVPPNAASGTYILNVDIKLKQTGELYSTVQKLYVDVS